MRRQLNTYLIACLVMLAAACHAQTTQIVATHLRISGIDIATGSVNITPLNSQGNPTSFLDGTGMESGSLYACRITGGALVGAIQPDNSVSGTCAVPDAILANPELHYSFSVCGRIGTQTRDTCWSLNNVAGVTGATWALDRYAPANPSLSGIAPTFIPFASVMPSSCSLGQVALNTTTFALLPCVGQAFRNQPTSGDGVTGTINSTTLSNGAPQAAGYTASGNTLGPLSAAQLASIVSSYFDASGAAAAAQSAAQTFATNAANAAVTASRTFTDTVDGSHWVLSVSGGQLVITKQ